MTSNPFPTFTALLLLPGRVWDWLRGIPRGRLLRFDVALFARQLASMLRSDVPLPQALTYLGDEFVVRVRARIEAVRTRIANGEPLSAALGELPASWLPEAWRAAVAAGERCGRLPEILDQLADEAEHVHDVRRRLRAIATYPLAVLLFAGLVTSIVLWKVIPVFASLYNGLRVPLPLGTRVVIAVSDAWLLPVNLVLLLLLVHLGLRALFPGVRLPLSWLGARLSPYVPFGRGLRQSVLEVRFARTLRLLLDAGVALPEALDLCERVVADSRVGRLIAHAARRIRAGELPSQALAEVRAVSPAFLWFLAGSEQRGDFVDVTAAMASAAEERMATRIEFVERALEPASIVFTGLAVGFLVVSFYLPMFRLISLVGQ